jgi:hypothetical protein
MLDRSFSWRDAGQAPLEIPGDEDGYGLKSEDAPGTKN